MRALAAPYRGGVGRGSRHQQNANGRDVRDALRQRSRQTPEWTRAAPGTHLPADLRERIVALISDVDGLADALWALDVGAVTDRHLLAIAELPARMQRDGYFGGCEQIELACAARGHTSHGARLRLADPLRA